MKRLGQALSALSLPTLAHDKRCLANGTLGRAGGLSDRSLERCMKALEAWPPCQIRTERERALANTSQTQYFTFAHLLWAVAWPCVEWISQSLQGQQAGPWHARLSGCLELLQHDFVGLEQVAAEVDVYELASLAQCLLESHLAVQVPTKLLVDPLLQLVRSGLPAVTVSVYLALLSPEVTRPLVGVALSWRLVTCLLACASHVPPPPPRGSLEAALKAELVRTLLDRRRVELSLDEAEAVVPDVQRPSSTSERGKPESRPWRTRRSKCERPWATKSPSGTCPALWWTPSDVDSTCFGNRTTRVLRSWRPSCTVGCSWLTTCWCWMRPWTR